MDLLTEHKAIYGHDRTMVLSSLTPQWDTSTVTLTLKPSPSEWRREPPSSGAGCGGLWRAAVGKTGRLSIEWGTTVEHTEWGACTEHARLQLNDNDN
jgi:hypothetical protein